VYCGAKIAVRSLGRLPNVAQLLTVRPAGDVHASAGGPPAMTADDQRFTLREAAY
jgi:hypothetical protein